MNSTATPLEVGLTVLVSLSVGIVGLLLTLWTYRRQERGERTSRWSWAASLTLLIGGLGVFFFTAGAAGPVLARLAHR